MARPHASRARAMNLARPRGGLVYIWPKLPNSMAPPLPLLVRRHHSRARAMALVCPRDGNDNGANSDNEHTKDRISSRLYTCAQRTVPSSSVGCPNAKDNNSGLF
ncbi:hypothetical protein PIB30_037128 [Stylosanthes scabra]|uniref:Uncharacterized protein n=1 Tax=Stylosanthes scabra TaxID=79078 RepID=A0ABU6QDY6_9FABA|nr:hypothetical protein [Stylosanthes scabra]